MSTVCQGRKALGTLYTNVRKYGKNPKKTDEIHKKSKIPKVPLNERLFSVKIIFNIKNYQNGVLYIKIEKES